METKGEQKKPKFSPVTDLRNKINHQHELVAYIHTYTINTIKLPMFFFVPLKVEENGNQRSTIADLAVRST